MRYRGCANLSIVIQKICACELTRHMCKRGHFVYDSDLRRAVSTSLSRHRPPRKCSTIWRRKDCRSMHAKTQFRPPHGIRSHNCMPFSHNGGVQVGGWGGGWISLAEGHKKVARNLKTEGNPKMLKKSKQQAHMLGLKPRRIYCPCAPSRNRRRLTELRGHQAA